MPKKMVRVVTSMRAAASAYAVRAEGIPLFDVEPWLQRSGEKETPSSSLLRRIDEEVEPELIVASDGVGFVFCGCNPTVRLTRNGVSFVFSDADELCGIVLEGISK